MMLRMVTNPLDPRPAEPWLPTAAAKQVFEVEAEWQPSERLGWPASQPVPLTMGASP
jgi:hypothetical protein